MMLSRSFAVHSCRHGPRSAFASQQLLQHRHLLFSSKAPDTVTDNNKNKKKKKSKTKKSNKSTFRADRVLANRGWGSRSECHELLRQKRVFQQVQDTKTDELVLKQILGPKEKISMDAPLFVDGKKEIPMPPPLLKVFHKPKWMLSVMSDSKGRPHLGELDVHNMHPVGRLDYDTSGLILFSSDGTLTQTLLHPNNKIQKQYQALVVGNVDEEELRQKLREGVKTSMGVFPADLVSSKSIPDADVKPMVDNILKNLPPEYDVNQLEEKGYLFFKDAKELSEVELVVEEGKHRMVRRILANSGYPVIGLKRLRLGAVHLDDLAEGTFRKLSPEEEEWAESLLKRKKSKG